MDNTELSLLKHILSQPAAPFFESHVVRTVTRIFTQAGVPFFTDPIGNIVVGVATQAEYRKIIQNKRIRSMPFFIAHMDHPGFHGVKWLAKNKLQIQWFGGSPKKYAAGSQVWLADNDRMLATGKLSNVVYATYGIDKAIVTVPALNRRPSAKKLFGGFDFGTHVQHKGKKIFTRAADDLVGVYSIVSLALDFFSNCSSKTTRPFIGILTRAEEVGFIGAIGHFKLGWLNNRKANVICVSLEASRAIADISLGKGPIVRLGDRSTLFSHNELQVLNDLALKTLGTLGEKYQKRIMDGGSCEGSVSVAFGFPTIALSVPLGNYHNQGFDLAYRARPNGPAPEFVHLDDIQGQVKLCNALINSNIMWNDPWKKRRDVLDKNFQKYKNKLRID